ncbi:putative calcium-binding protein CML44 [Raphanus sativus]|uniref:Probable calcium-binding protein CML44 n=1 Tax=Raphanus sativus TaxID=3726 RepID=A0A6J0NAL1_RAPSA|nr:probable calcium-binding protein CML44 [Raphanus sativus]KAJ4916332.1 putative calcium-binding protein CML44 [Raphanus sativus]
MDCSFISITDLQRMFQMLDKNQDGLVTLDELHWILERLGWSEHTPEELELFVGKKSLDLEEFLRFYDDAVSNRKETKSNSVVDNDDDAIVSAFNVFDVNGDGYISSEELRTVLERLGFEEETKSWDCGRMIRAHDKNLDGVIDIEEFKNMMLHVQ